MCVSVPQVQYESMIQPRDQKPIIMPLKTRLTRGLRPVKQWNMMVTVKQTRVKTVLRMSWGLCQHTVPW